jgi:hypothetical protein
MGISYTPGRYDFVIISDMPSKEMPVKFLVIGRKSGIGRTGNRETIPAGMLPIPAKEVSNNRSGKTCIEAPEPPAGSGGIEP